MTEDLVKRVVARRTLPTRIALEVAAGVEKLPPGGMFGPEFYDEARRQAGEWRHLASTAGRMTVLLPVGFFALPAGYDFPDMDISHLGIGAHRYFLYHSALGVWVLKKLHQAALVYVGDKGGVWDVVVRKIVGVALAGCAFGVGVHLLWDALAPKAVIFPFFGSLVDGTLVDDQVWLLANAVWCFKMSKDFFVLALGEELAAVKEGMQKFFGPVLKEGTDAVSGGHR